MATKRLLAVAISLLACSPLNESSIVQDVDPEQRDILDDAVEQQEIAEDSNQEEGNWNPYLDPFQIPKSKKPAKETASTDAVDLLAENLRLVQGDTTKAQKKTTKGEKAGIVASKNSEAGERADGENGDGGRTGNNNDVSETSEEKEDDTANDEDNSVGDDDEDSVSTRDDNADMSPVLEPVDIATVSQQVQDEAHEKLEASAEVPADEVQERDEQTERNVVPEQLPPSVDNANLPADEAEEMEEREQTRHNAPRVVTALTDFGLPQVSERAFLESDGKRNPSQMVQPSAVKTTEAADLPPSIDLPPRPPPSGGDRAVTSPTSGTPKASDLPPSIDLAPLPVTEGKGYIGINEAPGTPSGINEAPGTPSVATSELDAAITDMLLKGGGSLVGTPMADSVKQIKTLICSKMLPQVTAVHKDDQKEIDALYSNIKGCGTAKKIAFHGVSKQKKLYQDLSPLHKACRGQEAVLFTSATGCLKDLKDKLEVKRLKCTVFAAVAHKMSDEKAMRSMVHKSGGESVATYVRRITATVCGGKGGKGGMLDAFQKHRVVCTNAAKEYHATKKLCAKKQSAYVAKKSECNTLQDRMDNAACQRAVLVKDACESYAECYTNKLQAYGTAKKAVAKNERDRKVEYTSLKRMECLIDSFSDAKVTNKEIADCKNKTYDSNHLVINYPRIPKLDMCTVPKSYPSTAAYKRAEFTPLPTLAKGKQDTNECVGILEISTKPKAGPKTCKCERVTLNGPFSPGPLVKCQNCLEIHKSHDKNSCPHGTKLFSPRGKRDWRTFIGSALPLRDPNWVIDVTRPQNGCGGCTRHPMRSSDKIQGKGRHRWRTSDGSPWWLRSKPYNEPNGDYHANCYLDLWQTPKNENSITFNDGKCLYHSKSYYCQSEVVSVTPAKGSPPSCKCKKVGLTAKYSAGVIIRCVGCIEVRRTGQRNSCPRGTKLFAPASRADWKVVVDSVKPLRSPHWIIDVTRPQNGCGGCTRSPMNSKNPRQATWKTSDGAPWFLRSTKYNEPNGDYTANCYMDLWRTPANEDSITFNDGKCLYHSNAYYCQPRYQRKKNR